MKKFFTLFITDNKFASLGMVLGLILGYLHWYYFGCYWGTYPMSSECWVNCVAGLLFGGFIGSLRTRTKAE
jgi:uncharacterized membrane-anchored protein YhcB (DUF1043 family)